jgi:hypothetical protein
LCKGAGEFCAANTERQTRHFNVSIADEFRKHFFNNRFQQHRRAMLVQQQKLWIDSGFNWKLSK